MTGGPEPHTVPPYAPGDAANTANEEPFREFAAQAETVRAALGSKRSDKLLRLFEYLLARTAEGRAPSEMEIADAVFSTGRALDVSQDATVRVYVHRLRKTLDEIQSGQPRLKIPKGEYRIVLEGDNVASHGNPVSEPNPRTFRAGSSWRLIWIAFTLLVIANLVGWWRARAPEPQDPARVLANTRLWQPMAHDARPVTIVLGDYYMFADLGGQGKDANAPPRLVRDPAINSHEDLDVYLMRYPRDVGRFTDRNLSYVPTSAIVALEGLFRTIRAIRQNDGALPRVIPISQLTAEMLKTSDVVYVGLLSGLGPLLRNPVFQASGFKVGRTYDELVDSASGRHFMSDGVVIADEHIPRRDYGYIASLPGPSGNRILIIAGTRDPALLQMAEVAGDPEKLGELNLPARVGQDHIEALYQVRTMGNLNLSGTLLIARPLRSGDIWDTGKASQRFPDDAYEGGGITGHQ